jgi:hypothetical protein
MNHTEEDLRAFGFSELIEEVLRLQEEGKNLRNFLRIRENTIKTLLSERGNKRK